MFNCFCKECECKASGSYLNRVFVDICPKCNLKNSTFTITNLFRALTIEKPTCFKVKNTKYMVTTGTGLYNTGAAEIKGVFTLILADGVEIYKYGLSFEFVAFDQLFATTITVIGPGINIPIKKCSDSCIVEKDEQLTNTKETKDDSETYVNAKMFIFHKDNKVEEIDISDQFIKK